MDAQGNKRSLSKTFSLAQQNLAVANPVECVCGLEVVLGQARSTAGDGGIQGCHDRWRHPKPGAASGVYHPAKRCRVRGDVQRTASATRRDQDVVIPLDVQGSAKLPVWPVTSGVTGKANFMIDIPQLTVN